MAQPSFKIAEFNVLNNRYVRTTPRNQGINQIQNEKKEEENLFRLEGQGLTT